MCFFTAFPWHAAISTLCYFYIGHVRCSISTAVSWCRSVFAVTGLIPAWIGPPAPLPAADQEGAGLAGDAPLVALRPLLPPPLQRVRPRAQHPAQHGLQGLQQVHQLLHVAVCRNHCPVRKCIYICIPACICIYTEVWKMFEYDSQVLCVLVIIITLDATRARVI